MRLLEISKAEFHQRLTDPSDAELQTKMRAIRKSMYGEGWETSFKMYKQYPTAKITLFKPHVEFGEANRVENAIVTELKSLQHWTLASYDSDNAGLKFYLTKKD